jgi:threonine dehydratase
MLSFSDITAAHERIRRVVHRTPVLTSSSLDALAGNALFFKCENFQRVGAFKFRGAYNKLASLTAEERKRGVVAFSSGNHAQGVALAARLLGVSARIVMPTDSPRPKMEATRGYGAAVVEYDRLKEDREAIGRRIAEEENRILVPPFNDEFIMAGQGTIGLEMAEQIGELDYAFFPVGGGGLISGNAVSLKHLMPTVRIVGVETERANDVFLSFRKGEIVTISVPDTIADGMRTTAPGPLTFEVIRKMVDDIVLVSDAEVVEAMRLIYERLKIIVEPTAAVPFAAVRKNELNLRSKKIGVVLSGGNIDLGEFFSLLRKSVR